MIGENTSFGEISLDNTTPISVDHGEKVTQQIFASEST